MQPSQRTRAKPRLQHAALQEPPHHRVHHPPPPTLLPLELVFVAAAEAVEVVGQQSVERRGQRPPGTVHAGRDGARGQHQPPGIGWVAGSGYLIPAARRKGVGATFATRSRQSPHLPRPYLLTTSATLSPLPPHPMQTDMPATSSPPPAPHPNPALAGALRRHVAGEVRFDSGSRALYATDASNYPGPRRRRPPPPRRRRSDHRRPLLGARRARPPSRRRAWPGSAATWRWGWTSPST